jgi:hypothetical protein
VDFAINIPHPNRWLSQQSRLELGLRLGPGSQRRTIWVVDAHRGDGKRFIVHADEKLSAFVELERQVLTVTFYLEAICARGMKS